MSKPSSLTSPPFQWDDASVVGEDGGQLIVEENNNNNNNIMGGYSDDLENRFFKYTF